jgi:hypothetical protein
MTEQYQLTRPIPKEIVDKFIKKICEDAAKPLNLNINYSNMNNVNKLIIFTNNITESEKIHNSLMNKCCLELGDFIEFETNIDRKEWNRSIALFESSIEKNSVSLFW